MIHRLLDRSVVFSFDRTGFRRHRRDFPHEPERALASTRALVTGGTAGIGRAVVEGLTARGAQVETWARRPDRGAHVVGSGVTFRSVDLGDLDAVVAAARQVEGPLSAVVLNAGAMPLERRSTPQGHELVWGSQVLGHLLLLRVLRERRLLGPESRVVWVSSGGMLLVPLDLSDLRCERSYQRHRVYANAKRAQVDLCAHLAERWPEVPMAAMHPGWVATEAVRHSMPVFHALTRPLLRSTDQGADTILWLMAREAAAPTGRFWFDRSTAPLEGRPGVATSAAKRAELVAEVFSATDPYLESPCAA